jgi:hypothetical protein
MVHPCLLWCLWREKNDRCFEDREKTSEELKSLFFNTLYLMIATYIAHLVICFHDFLFSVCPYYLDGFVCILLVYKGASYAFNNILINYQKNYVGGRIRGFPTLPTPAEEEGGRIVSKLQRNWCTTILVCRSTRKI